FRSGRHSLRDGDGQESLLRKKPGEPDGVDLHHNPQPMSTMQALTPPALQRVVELCMAKEPRDRWQTAHDVMLQLRWISEGGSMAGLPQPVAHHRKYREWLA